MSLVKLMRRRKPRTKELATSLERAVSAGLGNWMVPSRSEKGAIFKHQLSLSVDCLRRGVTMDVALNSFTTPHRQITVLDAPGHKDFVPNMISGASQADCSVLVVDASTGEFEAGFDRGGQTREHLLLVRSLGVSQVIIAINKLDLVGWDKSRYDEICELLKPFLAHSGFQPSKAKFVPVAAMSGINLTGRKGPEAEALRQWYNGPTLVDLLGTVFFDRLDKHLTFSLDKLEPPNRDINSPLRFPISNVFKSQGGSTGVTGRVCGGVVQVGDRLRILPGDETGIVKCTVTMQFYSQPPLTSA
jgi:elongation factor 1 alpha-like protein